jgi:hypothetical protein
VGEVRATAGREIAMLTVRWTLADASKGGCFKPRKSNACRSA